MCVEQHRHAAPAELGEQVAHRPPSGRVECARRLVEQQQRRPADERLGEPEALLHALGHRLHAPPGRRPEADQVEQLGTLRGAAVRSGEALVERQQLVGGRPPREAEQLGEVAHRRTGGGRARRRAAYAHLAARRAHEPARDLHQRGLARAVGPKQADQLTLADVEVDAVQRLSGAVALGELTDGEGGHGRSARRPWRRGRGARGHAAPGPARRRRLRTARRTRSPRRRPRRSPSR
jgi:hypothetical protein